jgi:hypothetical protein
MLWQNKIHFINFKFNKSKNRDNSNIKARQLARYAFLFFYFSFKTLAMHQKKNNHGSTSCGNLKAGKFLKY